MAYSVYGHWALCCARQVIRPFIGIRYICIICTSRFKFLFNNFQCIFCILVESTKSSSWSATSKKTRLEGAKNAPHNIILQIYVYTYFLAKANFARQLVVSHVAEVIKVANRTTFGRSI